jgi:4-amino-4-deoxy-L-arabinose transferase-like glycosyltransferase
MDLLPATAALPAEPGTELAVSTAPDRATRRRELGRMFLVLLALTIAVRMPAFFVPVFNSDETFLATQAHVIQEGGQLYTQATDRKPPVVPYVYAATFAFFGTSALWSVRVVAMIAVALTALLLAIEARRRWGRRAGWIAGVLFVLAMVAFAPQDGQAANFEVFMLPSMTAAVLFARRGRGLAAGAAVSLATLAKQTGAATLLPVLYLLGRARGKRGIAAVAIGFAVPTALVALAVGPSQLLYWAVIGNGSYLGLATITGAVVTTFLFMSATWAACNLPILWRLPRAWHDRRLRADDGHTDTDLWLWAFSAAVSVAIGLRFFGHYYIQLVPPLVLLTAGTLARGSRRIATATIAFSAVCALAFSAAGYFMHPGIPEPNYESVSRYLATVGHPNDPIFVWGSVPEIYWASGKLPATRFLTTPFLTGDYPGRPPDKPTVDNTTQQAWTEFYQDFAAHPPRYFVDSSPTNVRGVEYYPLWKFPRLARIVAQHYRFQVSIDGFDVYVRK